MLEIELKCDPINFGVIAEPILAKSFLPDWYKKLPPIDKNEQTTKVSGHTIKKCMPFLDAMTTGFIMTTPADISFKVTGNGEYVETGHPFPTTLIESHKGYQIAGRPGPMTPIMKFITLWSIKTPPGYSCLFLPLINRENPHLEVFSGIVDTDNYNSYINFPFRLHHPDGLFVLPKGTPIAQVIPFKRTEFKMIMREETPEEDLTKRRQARSAMSGDNWYRKEARAKR